MVSFFAKVKIFRFWPKTMDYNKAFWPKLRSFFVVLLLLTGRCCGAEICAILLLLRCPFRWYPFLPLLGATIVPTLIRFHWTVMEKWSRNICSYNSTCSCDDLYPAYIAFWPKSRSFFVVLLLLTGRCCGAEICAILLLLRCPFRWYPFFLPKSNFSDSGQKPWTIIRRFGRNRGHSLWSFYSSLEGAVELKFVPFCSS